MNAKKCYVVICDLEGGIEIDSVWLNKTNAYNRLLELKDERNDLFVDYDDCMVFENDDVYWIKK